MTWKRQSKRVELYMKEHLMKLQITDFIFCNFKNYSHVYRYQVSFLILLLAKVYHRCLNTLVDIIKWSYRSYVLWSYGVSGH